MPRNTTSAHTHGMFSGQYEASSIRRIIRRSKGHDLKVLWSYSLNLSENLGVRGSWEKVCSQYLLDKIMVAVRIDFRNDLHFNISCDDMFAAAESYVDDRIEFILFKQESFS